MQAAHHAPVSGGPSSFAARRSAASSLPSFELPPPPLSNVSEARSQAFNSPTSGLPLSGSGSVASVGNLLTPPNATDGLSPTTAANVAAFANANNLAYSQNHFWPSLGQQTQTLAPSPSQQFSQSAQRQWIPPSGMYSPSLMNPMNSMTRGSDYGLPARNAQQTSQSSADLYHLPPFNASMSMPPLMNLPAVSFSPPQQATGSGAMPHQRAQSQMPSMNAQEPFGAIRLPPTPTYSNQATSTSSPSQALSPSSSSSHTMRPTTSTSEHHIRSAPGSLDMGQPLQSQQSPPQYQRPFGQVPLPSTSGTAQVNGPVMTNMHAPNANMALMGGSLPANLMPPFTSGHAANLQAMYAMHGGHPGQAPATDRPFKCDQCLQSFNRNHDLKRHKRIHLAVKPYPCAHCDKSFSRKDALKVCIQRSRLWRAEGTDLSVEAHVSKRMRQGLHGLGQQQ